MDKSKFTANPELDSEGFLTDRHLALQASAITLHPGEVVVVSNPPGWNEPGMQTINWAENAVRQGKAIVADALWRGEVAYDISGYNRGE